MIDYTDHVYTLVPLNLRTTMHTLQSKGTGGVLLHCDNTPCIQSTSLCVHTWYTVQCAHMVHSTVCTHGAQYSVPARAELHTGRQAFTHHAELPLLLGIGVYKQDLDGMSDIE